MTMQFYIKNSLFIFLLYSNFFVWGQQQPNTKADYIHILYADHATSNAKYPGKQLLSGNVEIEHNGALLFCDKAIVDKHENLAIAIGHVRLQQGDTLQMQAGYLKYDGNRSFAEASEKVQLSDQKMHLSTDTLYFDRIKQESYYTCGGKIVDSVNNLTSRIGRYFLKEKRFQFQHNVHLTNPDYQLDSYQLDYFPDTGISNFYGPTKIYNTENYIYAEKGHYDSQKKISWFVKNAFIKHKHTTIKADSLYYDQNKSYASGSKKVVLHDSINKTWIFSSYGQRWLKLDSTRVSQNPLVVSAGQKDTLFLRAEQFVTAGPKAKRRTWAYPDVRFYSREFSGKADSLYRDNYLHIMKLLQAPVLWHGLSQITGQEILLKNDTLNRHLDSLIIPNNVFIIQKDSIGFNQIKGKKLLGKFEKDRLKTIDIYGNTEIIYFLREETGKLAGIEKNKSSHIFILFDKGKIALLRLYEKPEGTVFPYKDFLKQKQKFKGFKWRGTEQIKNKNDIIGPQLPLYEAETKQKPTYMDETPQKEKLFK